MTIESSNGKIVRVSFCNDERQVVVKEDPNTEGKPTIGIYFIRPSVGLKKYDTIGHQIDNQGRSITGIGLSEDAATALLSALIQFKK